jgi:uncharacterized tellurite resistance protein B-like protein
MLSTLDRDARLQLMKFVCSFAWADLEVNEAERRFVHDLIDRLELDPEERDAVEGWLNAPPEPDEVDPQEIPVEHREIFLKTTLALIAADGELAEAETETYNLLSQLVR